MHELVNKTIHCPYCGEPIEILVDCSIASQNYIEDCQVCCRPITIDVVLNDDGEPVIQAKHENE